MKKWEYKVHSLGVMTKEEPLNKLGKEGWEMVGFFGTISIFKRELK